MILDKKEFDAYWNAASGWKIPDHDTYSCWGNYLEIYGNISWNVIKGNITIPGIFVRMVE